MNILNNYLSGNGISSDLLEYADVNRDGYIDEKDSELMQKYINGEIDKF